MTSLRRQWWLKYRESCPNAWLNYLGGWTSSYTSYLDVNRRISGFWPIAIWGFPWMEVPPNGWFIMDNATKLMILGYPDFRKPPYWKIIDKSSWVSLFFLKSNSDGVVILVVGFNTFRRTKIIYSQDPRVLQGCLLLVIAVLDQNCFWTNKYGVFTCPLGWWFPSSVTFLSQKWNGRGASWPENN